MNLLSLLKQKLNPQWEVWREIPPEGDLEYKLGESLSEQQAFLDGLNYNEDLLRRVYASVKEECQRDNHDKVHVVVLSPQSPTGNHLLLTYPGKTFDDKAKRRLREQGYFGPHLYHQSEPVKPVEPFHLFTPILL